MARIMYQWFLSGTLVPPSSEFEKFLISKIIGRLQGGLKKVGRKM
jgi:hypothetical protein